MKTTRRHKMKARIYKLYYIFPEDSKKTVFYQAGLYSEKELRERFKEAIEDEQLNGATIKFFELDKPQDIDAMPIDLIADIFEYDGYEIEYQELEI